jgi:hypothetical protein
MRLLQDPRPLAGSAPGVPYEISCLVRRMLAKEPSLRPNMTEVAKSLEARTSRPDHGGQADPAERRSAIDLLPIAKKLPCNEQVQLAMLLLRGAVAQRSDANAYAAAPPSEDEFSSDEDALAWEGEGWEEFYAKG